MSRMPVQKPGRSKQDYCTPPEFLYAVQRKLEIPGFACDLAASAENTCAPVYWDVTNSALDDDVRWTTEPWAWNWCNMPFEKITPWVQKAWTESCDHGAQSALLVPLSIADWWRDWVHGKCQVLLLHGRITFVGETSPYPKDCALLLYTPQHPAGMADYEIWSWRAS